MGPCLGGERATVHGTMSDARRLRVQCVLGDADCNHRYMIGLQVNDRDSRKLYRRIVLGDTRAQIMYAVFTHHVLVRRLFIKKKKKTDLNNGHDFLILWPRG